MGTYKLDARKITSDVFVGREEELAIIREAIFAPGINVINIQGEGGIGKTKLLSKIQKEYKDVKKEDKDEQRFYISNILDFFQTATQTPNGFQEMLRNQENFPHEAFEHWRKEWDDYNLYRLVGMPGNKVQEQRAKAEQAFRTDFVNLTEDREPILLIDTFEVVQDTIGPWLVNLLAALVKEAGDTEGATFIIAGRRNKEWEPELLEYLPEERVWPIELKSLQSENVDTLFDEVVTKVPQDERDKIKLLTNREPLLVALALDWQDVTNIPWKYLTTTSARYTLSELQQMGKTALKQAQNEFEKDLMKQFYEAEGADIIWKMAWVYKRFDANILAYLNDISKSEAEETLESMRQWSFMKYDERTNTYQLHDKMRDMVQSYLWPEIDPSWGTRRELSKRMMRYYDEQLQKLNQQIEDHITAYRQAELRGETKTQRIVKLREIQLRREKSVLEAHRVYYGILADRDAGLLYCNQGITNDTWALDEESIAQKQREREDALNSLQHPEVVSEYQIKLEKARILTIIREDYPAALEILEELDREEIYTLPRVKETTFFAKVKNYESLCIGYLPPLSEAGELHDIVEKWVGDRSPLEVAVKVAQEAVDFLQDLRRTKGTDNLDSDDMRSIHRSLSRAYQAQAYPLARMGRLQDAIKAYETCLKHARQGVLPATQSHALNDLAFSSARIGRINFAIRRAQEALQLREALGLDYFVGLSLNTLGRIYFLDDKPYQARGYSERALRKFDHLEDTRGKGLAYLALGQMYVRIAELEYDQKIIKSAESYLEKAKSIFSNQLVEPSRLAEVYERLGILYLVWGGHLLMELGEAAEEVLPHYQEADRYFKRAVDSYENSGQAREQTVALERWARVDFDRGVLYKTIEEEYENEFANGEEKLAQAKEIVQEHSPGTFFQVPNTATSSKKSYPEYGLSLGKIEMGEGRLSFERYAYAHSELKKELYLKQAAEHFALSCAYLERFSPVARELESALNIVDKIVRSLKPAHIALFKSTVSSVQKELNIQEYKRLSVYLQETVGFRIT
jgi:tetratricopeptide (TPR) repeat protein